MLISPRPGVDRENLRRNLRFVAQDVGNLHGGGPHDSYDRLVAYLAWTTNAVRMLGKQISDADLQRLVFTRTYQTISGGFAHLADRTHQRVANALLNLELEQRTEDFTAAVEALDAQIDRWNSRTALLVADTSFHIQHPKKIREVDFACLRDFGSANLRLLFPMMVIDELDSLKRSKDRHTKWRAAHTLGVLDESLRQPDISSDESGARLGGGIPMEVLFDPHNHHRLPIPDDEIVDRALAAQALAGGPLLFLTYDTGQSMRARNVGLDVIKLLSSVDTDPEP
ncbi:PIN domain-containing protein [Streptomyces sp. NPDC056500]|uniref:PIN domain-containing protein n=1 Tax=Streptomyces sp. NPDC056500 TaxID=3345840 RepID=UPI0036BC006F